MVGITLTAELLGVSGGHGSMVRYNKRFTAMNGRNVNLACLADMQAAAALGRAWSDFGLWLLPRGRAPVYLRLTGAAKWAEWHKRSKAAPCRQPSKSLPVADITIYPPAAQQQFESMARMQPVLTRLLHAIPTGAVEAGLLDCVFFAVCCEKERKKTYNPREGWENGTPVL